MKKDVDFKLITHTIFFADESSKTMFEINVKEYLEKGYELHGPTLTMNQRSAGYDVLQAVVKFSN